MDEGKEGVLTFVPVGRHHAGISAGIHVQPHAGALSAGQHGGNGVTRVCMVASLLEARPGQLVVSVAVVDEPQGALALGGFQEAGSVLAQAVGVVCHADEQHVLLHVYRQPVQPEVCAAHVDLPYWQHVVLGGRHVDKLRKAVLLFSGLRAKAGTASSAHRQPPGW